jgi:hypothetical protein
MPDDCWSPTSLIPERRPTPGKLLSEFVRASDQAPTSCELHQIDVQSRGFVHSVRDIKSGLIADSSPRLT